MEQIDLTTVEFQELVTHHVGSKYHEEKVELTEAHTEVAKHSMGYLYTYLVKPFEDIFEYYHFAHVDNLALNPVYQIVKHLFNEEDNLITASQKIADHLYEESDHPNIKSGQVTVVHMSNVKHSGGITDAIGIFKTETRVPFLTLDKKEKNYKFNHELGIDLKGLDKGCIILNTMAEKGYQVMIVDKSNKQGLAHFWRDHFLQVLPSKTDFNQTKSYMDLTKSYFNDQVDKDFLLPKADKIDLMNRSLEYFKENEEFSKEQFEEEVFGQEDLINSFRNYDHQYKEDLGIDLNDNFAISMPAVKRNARVFRSVLKLDKNFHIYVHGNRELIERGEEADGRKYYKLYFDQES
jgi:hypothetical protein